jgi:hypothetical protein
MPKLKSQTLLWPQNLQRKSMKSENKTQWDESPQDFAVSQHA